MRNQPIRALTACAIGAWSVALLLVVLALIPQEYVYATRSSVRHIPLTGFQPAEQQQQHVVRHKQVATAASSSIMFGVIGKNVAVELPYVLRNIGRLAARFLQAHVVFVENDSTDATRAVFNAWAADFTSGFSNRTARLVPLKLDNPSENRMTVLAKARNIYLDQLGLPEFANVSLLMGVDADMCHAWDCDNMVGVIDALLPAMATEWHVLTANGVCGWYTAGAAGEAVEVPPHTPGSKGTYCDLLALRSLDGRRFGFGESAERVSFVPGACEDLGGPGSRSSPFACRYINGQAVVPVKSAFGGLALYDASMFRPRPEGPACRYDENPSTCEHWSLADCLQQQLGAKHVVATGLVVNWEGCSEQQQHKWDDSAVVAPVS